MFSDWLYHDFDKCRSAATDADASIVGRGVGVERWPHSGATDLSCTGWCAVIACRPLSTQGFSVLVSQTFGSNDKKDCARPSTSVLPVRGGIGILLTVQVRVLSRLAAHHAGHARREHLGDGAHLFNHQ